MDLFMGTLKRCLVDINAAANDVRPQSKFMPMCGSVEMTGSPDAQDSLKQNSGLTELPMAELLQF